MESLKSILIKICKLDKRLADLNFYSAKAQALLDEKRKLTNLIDPDEVKKEKKEWEHKYFCVRDKEKIYSVSIDFYKSVRVVITHELKEILDS